MSNLDPASSYPPENQGGGIKAFHLYIFKLYQDLFCEL